MNSAKNCNTHEINKSHAPSSKLEQQLHGVILFVYGTLKRGFANHGRFCRNAIDIRPASIWGRLYQLPAGYPALVIPESAILAHGTADPLADVATQAHFISSFFSTVAHYRPSGDWDLIQGELITLPDPLRDLPPIDRLEGFHPGFVSFYHRVLALIQLPDATSLAWLYVASDCLNGSCQRLRSSVWERGSK